MHPNDPAFPIELEIPSGSSDPLATPHKKKFLGLTKLEHAAIEAMKGVLSNPHSADRPKQEIIASSISAAKALLSRLSEEE